jgi:hypothetical protein
VACDFTASVRVEDGKTSGRQAGAWRRPGFGMGNLKWKNQGQPQRSVYPSSSSHTAASSWFWDFDDQTESKTEVALFRSSEEA